MRFVKSITVCPLLMSLAFTTMAWAAGDVKPELSLWDINKRPQKLSQYRGKIVIVNFWATWCENCKSELPLFLEEQRRYKDRSVIVIAASVDDATTVKRVQPFAKRLKLNFPVWIGATVDDLERLGLGEAVPATAFFDCEGSLAGRVKGVVRKDDLEHRIEWLLGNHDGPSPEPVVDNVSPK